MNQNEHSTPIQQEYSDIKQLLDTLPPVALPAGLSVASMWEKYDAVAEKANKKHGKVIPFLNKYRPALSYAAVFILIVVVYYSMGIDMPKTMSPMESTEMSPNMAMDAPAPAASAPQAMSATGNGLESSGESESAVAENRSLQDEEEISQFFVAEAADQELSVGDDEIFFYKTVAANAEIAKTGYSTVANSNFAKKLDLYEDGTKRDYSNTKSNHKVLSYDREDGDGNAILLYEGGLSVGSIIMPSQDVIDMFTMYDNILITINQIPGNVENYSEVCRETVVADVTGQLIGTECVNAVAITAYDIMDRTTPQLIQQYIQEGDYITHRRYGDNILLASYKPIEGYTYLGEVAPMATVAGQVKMSQLPVENVHVYPEIDANEYLLLTEVTPSETGMQTATAAVLGNNMKVQLPITDTAFVLALNAPSSAKALDTFELGSVTFELR